MDPRRIPIWEKSYDWLKDVGLNPRKVIDVGCGGGEFTRYLERLYSGAEIVGLDTSVKSLLLARAWRRLKKGCAVQGNVYNLEDPQNPVARPKKFRLMECENGGVETYMESCQILGSKVKFEYCEIMIKDREKIQCTETEPPKDFDLVTAIDVAPLMSLSDLGRAWAGKTKDNGVPSVGTIAHAAREGGHVLHVFPAFNGYMGHEFSEDSAEKIAEVARKSAESEGLEFLGWRFIGDVEQYRKRESSELDMGILYRRLNGTKT